MSIEHSDKWQTPETGQDFSIEPSDTLAIDGLSEVSLERKKQAAIEKYGDELDFERSQQLERELKQTWPFVSMFDVGTWADRSGRTKEARELVDDKYTGQIPPEDNEAKNQLLYGIYRQAWEKVQASNEDLDAWTVLRWCLENDLKNRRTYYPGSEPSGRLGFYDNAFGHGWEYERPGSPSYWSTQGDVNFEFPDFTEARAESIETRSAELGEYEERVNRRDDNLVKLEHFVSAFYKSMYTLKDPELEQEIRDFNQSCGQLPYKVRQWESGGMLYASDMETVSEKMQGDFSEEVELAEALFEKLQSTLSAEQLKEMEEERLKQVEYEKWMITKEEELRPILNVIRTREVTNDENGQRYEKFDDLTEADILTADAIKKYAEEAAVEAGGSELARIVLDTVHTAPFGRARQLAYMGESLPTLARNYGFSRAGDLYMYLGGAIAWLEQLSLKEEAVGTKAESNSIPEIVDDMEMDQMLALLKQQMEGKRL